MVPDEPPGAFRVPDRPDGGAGPNEALGLRLRAGRWDALESIHLRHVPRLKRLALAFGFSESDAEDAVQETLLRVWRFRHQAPDTDGKLGSWLTAILANCCKEHLLKKNRLRRLLDRLRLHAPPPPALAPETSLHGREMWELLAQAVGQLDPLDRLVLALARLEGLKAPEIARMLGLQPGAVRVRLFRALRRLRKLLEENDEW